MERGRGTFLKKGSPPPLQFFLLSFTNRLLRAVEKLLVENEIEPAAELVPRFDDLSGERERNDAL